jgi:hypothetical protein
MYSRSLPECIPVVCRAKWQKAISTIRPATSQSRRGRLDGLLESKCPLDIEFAAIEPRVRGRKKVAKIVATEADFGNAPYGTGNDTVDSAGLVADLNAYVGGDVETAITIDFQTVGAAFVDRVGLVEMKKSLLVFDYAVGLDLEAINPVCSSEAITVPAAIPRGP